MLCPLKKVPFNFKFESKWTTHSDCVQVVSRAWESRQGGSNLFGLAQKLKKCKVALLEWSRQVFGKDKLKLKLLQSNLKAIQSLPFSQENFRKEKEILKEIEILLLREEMALHQRSRVNWLSYGDKNSAFFHATINQRRQRNQILMLKSNRGDWIQDEDGINGLISKYFSNLFDHSGIREFSDVLSVVERCITDEMNCALVREVSVEEIKHAAFELGSLKALGPDGYSGFFFQTFWEKVGESVCKAVKRFFSNGFMLKELNNTNIVLIPKVMFPESLGQFRPISLCNFSLKVISKVMANRLKNILIKVITPNQSAFVPGRMIQDNVIVAHEAFHFLKMKKKGQDGFMVVKLDFNKAYDRVEWDFVEALLVKMGFHQKWVQWVVQCISTVSFNVCINGEARVKIRPRRGIRQGDPLSPYLFVIVKDVLSRMLSKACRDKALVGIKMARNCPHLSHVFFADDAILFLKAEMQYCKALKTILKDYGRASGQRINFDKSGIAFSSNLSANDNQLVCDFFDIPLMKLDSKYLGLPSFWGKSKSKADAYFYLVERALYKMQGWKCSQMSQGGKETMIKSVVQAIPSYAMSCFLLPKSICDSSIR